MTYKSLFSVLLKILGVLFIKDFLVALPQLLSYFVYINASSLEAYGIMPLLVTLLTFILYAWIVYMLLFKTEQIIEKLKLHQDFDEGPISLNLHRSTMLSIAVIVIGGLMVADGIPVFLQQLYEYYKSHNMDYDGRNPAVTLMVWSMVKIIIGLLMIGHQNTIVQFIEYRRKR